MRDIPQRRGPAPGGGRRRLGREKVHVGPDRTAVGVGGAASALELGAPLRKGQRCHRDVKRKRKNLQRGVDGLFWLLQSVNRESVFNMENILFFTTRRLSAFDQQGSVLVMGLIPLLEAKQARQAGVFFSLIFSVKEKLRQRREPV